MRRFSLVGLVLLVVAAAGCARSSSSTDQTAELRILAGTVEVAVGSADFVAATDGQVLEAGHTVRTGADGRASIEYFDGSVTRLDHNTTFTITTLETLNNEDESKVIEGEQADGSTYTRVVSLTDSASRFDVETPTATASVQGTVYAIIVNPDGSTTFAVVDGAVNVLSGDTDVSVESGFMVTVFPDGTVSEPQPIPPELLDSEWITYNQCDIDGERDCDIEAGPLASIEISPETAEVDANEPQEYTAEGFDADGISLGALEVTYEIADGVCEAASCSATSPGDHIVTGTFGEFTDTATLTVGLGEVVVTLDWDGPADLDLWVTDPGDETVKYDSDSSSGGSLDDDSNKDCEAAAPPPPEVISWEPGTAPLGSYTVTVDYWTECGVVGPVAFTLTVTVNGQVVLSTGGTVADVESSFEVGFTVSTS